MIKISIIRPKIQVLDKEYKTKIYEEAKIILETHGVFIENEEAINLLKQRGVNNKNSRFYLPPDLVEKCLSSVPNEITLYDRDGNKHISLKDDQIHYDPGSAAIFIFDEITGEIRAAQSTDFIRFSKIVEHLQYIEAQ
ncbi:unnamed protein product, partial [marine sediment metagenome]